MFAVYVFAGTFVQGIAAVTLAVVLLRRRGFLSGIAGDEQLHDLGKMLFAFLDLLGRTSGVSQYLLIWYGQPARRGPVLRQAHAAVPGCRCSR